MTKRKNACRSCGACPSCAALANACACVLRDEEADRDNRSERKIGVQQYPDGKTDDLWMAHFRPSPDVGSMNGGCYKLSGTLVEVAAEVAQICEEEGCVLQCLRRRY